MGRLNRLSVLAVLVWCLGVGIAQAGAAPHAASSSHASPHGSSHAAPRDHGHFGHRPYRGGYFYWGVGPGWWGPCGWGWGWGWAGSSCSAYWWGVDPLYFPNGIAPPPPPPDGLPPNAPAPGAATLGLDLFMYPKTGQSAEQQGTDRYECHRWAADQTGFDPSQGSPGVTERKRDDYLRAMSACLEGRGYSVK